jgi:hypothetical protein
MVCELELELPHPWATATAPSTAIKNTSQNLYFFSIALVPLC